MNEKRNSKTFIIALLLLVVVGLSVAYAVLTQQLTITGVGTVKGATWKILFTNLSEPVKTPNAEIDTDAELINDSTTMTFAVSLKQPGDHVSYTFDVTNQGTIDAQVNEVTLTGITEAMAANVDFKLTYASGEAIMPGDQLLSGQSRSLMILVSYDPSAETVPSEDIVLDLGATIDYLQK